MRLGMAWGPLPPGPQPDCLVPSSAGWLRRLLPPVCQPPQPRWLLLWPLLPASQPRRRWAPGGANSRGWSMNAGPS